jgi:hypothetical protein
VLPGIERADTARTMIVPKVAAPPPRGGLRVVLPWVGFGLIAVAVVAGTTLWSAALRQAPQQAAIDRTTLDTAARSAPPSSAVAPTGTAATTTAPAAPAPARRPTAARRHSSAAEPPPPAVPATSAPPVTAASATPAPTTVTHPPSGCLDPLLAAEPCPSTGPTLAPTPALPVVG